MSTKQLLLFHGPIFSGKHCLYQREYGKTHVAVYPAKLFTENTEMGIRDVALTVVKDIKKERNIAIIDTNECKKTRLSYISLVQKKCDDVSMAIISIIPKYGCQQLFWAREISLAEDVLLAQASLDVRGINRINDAAILKWFNSDADTDICYSHDKVEAPNSNEGCEVMEHALGLYARSTYKFDVAALFIQWECFPSESPGQTGIQKLADICRIWSGQNPSGRIIVICDGSQIHTGETSRSQMMSTVDEVIKKFTHLYTGSPVYAFYVSDPKTAGRYVIPPNPGILAYLQRRHCINLHSRRSVYVYESTSHMRMADHAGLRHIKISKLSKNPAIVNTSHAITTPSIPAMLKDMKILANKSSSEEPVIPLYDQVDQFQNGKILTKLPHGRCECLYAKMLDTIERYQSLYKKHATRLDATGSIISPCKKSRNQSNNEETEERTSQHNVSMLDQSTTSVGSRDLPTWMMKKKSSSIKHKASLDDTDSDVTNTENKVKKTVYVMTEKELTEVACEILKQAGKTKLVDDFLARTTSTTKEATSSKEVENTTRSKANRGRSNASQRQQKDRRHHGDSVGEVNDSVMEQLASLCPKIEADDSGLDNSDESDHSTQDQAEHHSQTCHTNNKRVTSAQNTVSETREWEKNKKHETSDQNSKTDYRIRSIQVNSAGIDNTRKCESRASVDDNNALTSNKLNKQLAISSNKVKDRAYQTEDVVDKFLDDFTSRPASRRQSPRKRKVEKDEWECVASSKQACLSTDRSDKRSVTRDTQARRYDNTSADVTLPRKRQTPDLSILDDIF